MRPLEDELGLTLKGKRMLVFVAHYDDEALFCGGMLLRAAIECESIAIVILTEVKSTNAPKGAEHLLSASPWESARQRRRLNAFSAVCQTLDADSYHFNLLNLSKNPSVGDLSHEIIFSDGVALLSRLVDKIGPNVVVTHGVEGEYGHPQHIVAHDIARRVWRGPVRCFARPEASIRKVFTVAVDSHAKRSLLSHYRYKTTQEAEWNPYQKPEYRHWCGAREYFIAP